MIRRLACSILTLFVATAAAAESPWRPEAPAPAPQAASANFTLAWSVLDSNGGGGAQSPAYRALLTVGQTVGGSTSNATGRAVLGFWTGALGELFADGFESGDMTRWSSTAPAD